MPRNSPVHYIDPSAISITPNANGLYDDIAVYVARGAKIKVYSKGVSQLDMTDATYREWTFSGRNRHLSDSNKPYTIYGRLPKTDTSKGYLVFAEKTLVDGEWTDKYPYVTMNGLATGTVVASSSNYWWIRLGDVSLPEGGKRTVDMDTGILGTDQFNTEWNLDPDDMPLRVEIGCTIDGKDAGNTPYVAWDKSLLLRAKLVEGWVNADVSRFRYWTIERNTGDETADRAWPSPARAEVFASSGNIVLDHVREGGDDFNGAVSTIFTVTAWGVPEEPDSSGDSSSSVEASDSSSSGSGEYVALAVGSIAIMAETVEKYELELSHAVVSYDPSSDTYSPADGVRVRIRATDQRGSVSKLTCGQLADAGLLVQYALVDTDDWTTLAFSGSATAVAESSIPVSAFLAQQNMNVRIGRVVDSDSSSSSSGESVILEMFRTPIAFVRNGEDTKEREWIFLRSTGAITFGDLESEHPLPALINGGEVDPEEAASGYDTNKNQDGWVPEGWWDEMRGTDETNHYEYAAYRDYIRDSASSDSGSSSSDETRAGHWGEFSDPRIWSYYAEDGVSYRCRWTLNSVEIWQLTAAYTGAFRGTLPLVATLMRRKGNGTEEVVTASSTIIEVKCEGITYSQIVSTTNPQFVISTEEHSGFIPYLNNVELTGLSITFTVDGETFSFSIPVIREADEDSVKDTIDYYGGSKFLSKVLNDVAQGFIRFVRGISFGTGNTGITEDGDATLSSVKTKGYSGTDIVSDKGFRVWEDSEGKSHVITDYFTARVKAFFASLEIRKAEHSAGNRIESPAGNTLALVKKYGIDSHGDPYEIVDKWYARRYGFGLSWGFKLVYSVGQYFGFWQEDPSATVAFYRCYWTADDKEAKKAVENNWKIGDQAYCQTFNLRVPQGSGFASNKHYWRLVVGKGFETIEGVEYAYIDLSNEETLYLEASKIDTPIDAQVVSGLIACSGYDTGSDRPEAGDDVACLGNQVSWSTRGGAKQTITYDPHPDTSGITVPCVKMYAGINSFSALDNFRFKKESPSGIYVHSDKFQIVSAAGTGASSPVYCQRGAYNSSDTYGKNDIVQYHGASWLYINDTPSSDHAPAEGEFWTAFAQRGMGTPQVELDSVNAVVSANYEGKITNISAATGLPTTIEVYVDGNQIPVSAWDLANSYVKYYNNTIKLNYSIFPVVGGISISNITRGADNVTLSWQYRQERAISGDIDPVINSTDIVVHVVFTYNGETYSADVSAPMIVQKAAASVIAQYSADGTNWEDSFNESHGHIYVRYSYDGGSTWTPKIRIVGKSIEFEAGIRHFTTYTDLWNYLDGKTLTTADVGYYLADTDDSSTPVAEATLWSLPSTDLRQFTEVQLPLTGEVNYLTSYDGHLWSAENGDLAWADLGVIQGADGLDGISVTLDPATVIFEQDEDNQSTFTPSPSSFMATVNVWQGATRLAANSYKVAIVSTTHCSATVSGNQITSLSLGKDSNDAYYSSGDVTLGVWLDPTSTSQNPDVTLKFNWAANLLGSWKLSVKGAVVESISSQECAYYDEDGNVATAEFSTVFGQNPQNIFVALTGLKGMTGIDVTNGKIDLFADVVSFRKSKANAQSSDEAMVWIDGTNGTLHAIDGDFQGTLNAKSYLTRYADLETYCYDAATTPRSKFVAPGYTFTMYDASGNSLDIRGFWCLRVGVQDMEVWLPTKLPRNPSNPNNPYNNIDLTGQRVTLYNPHIGYSTNPCKVMIHAGEVQEGGILGQPEIIRGVGLPVNSTDPVLIDQYVPVDAIEFSDGIIELQCLPSNVQGVEYEWCVVNLGTNVYKLHGRDLT